jgi:VWFA-related protein
MEIVDNEIQGRPPRNQITWFLPFLLPGQEAFMFPVRRVGAVCTVFLAIIFLLPGMTVFTAAQAPAAKLEVTTRLVLVDVVVTDSDGRPITGLTRDDFTILEQGKPQPVAVFSAEQLGAEPGPAAEVPPLPPYTYTNKAEYSKRRGPLTIILMDALNTPVKDQMYARQQSLEYLRNQYQKGQAAAVFALGDTLAVLQDFTTNPELLRAALESYAVSRSSKLEGRVEALQPPLKEVLVAAAGEAATRAVFERTRFAVNQFESERISVATDLRVAATLEALDAIARACAGYPGRKNLIWISGAFPLYIMPSSLYSAERAYSAQVTRTANLLSEAQIAVYPVDARGLVGVDLARPIKVERGDFVRPMVQLGAAPPPPPEPVYDPQATMKQLAEDTGGRAYINRNDIDRAVALSVADGSSYYTLGYYPTNKKWDGKFRNLKVELRRKGVDVRHRRGYWAIDPLAPVKDAKVDERELFAVLRGDPVPATGITFTATVEPPPPAATAAFPLDFLLDGHTLSFEPLADGRMRYNLAFYVVVFDQEGKQVMQKGKAVDAGLKPEVHQQVQERGFPFRFDMELPPGRYRLRLAVRDLRSGRVGSTDVPLLLAKP